MATETIIAERSQQTNFGTQETKLVRRGAKHVLIHDMWCGFGSLQGESLKPQQFNVPDHLAEKIAYAIAHADEPLGDDTHLTEWDYFESHLLEELGTQKTSSPRPHPGG